MKIKAKTASQIVLLTSIAFFLFSLTQQSFYVVGKYDVWANSFIIFLVGILGVIMGGGAAITWLANPILFLSWIIPIKKLKLKLVLSFIAAATSLSFSLFDQVITSEAPTYSKILELKLGYWLWCCSMTIHFLGMLAVYKIKKSEYATSANGA